VGFFGMFFLGALYLQEILGYSALGVGVAFLPASFVMGTLSLRYSERLIMGFGARPALIAGLACAGAGLLVFARSPVAGSYVSDVLPVMLLLGVGAGLAFPALMTLAMSGATRSDSGLASGLINTTVQVGGAIGLAVIATLATERTNALEAGGHSTASALNSGYHLAYLIGAALVAVAIAIAIGVVRSAPATGKTEAGEEEAGRAARDAAYAEAA
jgi:MFS family permease